MKKNKKEQKEKKSFLIALGDLITNYRYFLLVLFLGLSVFFFININKVNINNSIVSYLPDDTETKQGMDIMEEEFDSLSTIKLMVSNIQLEEASQLVTELSEINNVKSVLFDGTEA